MSMIKNYDSDAIVAQAPTIENKYISEISSDIILTKQGALNINLFSFSAGRAMNIKKILSIFNSKCLGELTA